MGHLSRPSSGGARGLRRGRAGPQGAQRPHGSDPPADAPTAMVARRFVASVVAIQSLVHNCHMLRLAGTRARFGRHGTLHVVWVLSAGNAEAEPAERLRLSNYIATRTR
ncbi:hypothetical protein CMP1-70 [Clavibacter phage CMP1]|uniref:Uncharacterized protein n=1 Tax=Clavibacter phage CMP1 TaxID=686439 RepID=D0U254_9CAUD|nr:hypothetical protein CMP1-70 [Clavibacter phage CMP1]ACY35962.1 hypothetical protein CMP1-70 [Clavibacter phage CMP1]